MIRKCIAFVVIVQAFIDTGRTQICDITRPCGNGNITKEVCERRMCCHMIKRDTLETCYQKMPLPITEYEKRIPLTEDFPEDSIQLPEELREKLENMGNLTKKEAVAAINEFEKYLRDTARDHSELDWNIEKRDAYRALVMVDPDSILQPITFSSGTRIQLLEQYGTIVNSTVHEVHDIRAVIFVEYPILIDVFKREQTPRRKGCPAREEYLEGAPVISINAFDKSWNKLSVPITYTVQGLNTSLLQGRKESDLSCTYLQEVMKDWKSDGCSVSSIGSSSMTCMCNHTTKFSMLFVLNDVNLTMEAKHLKNINTLEYIMETLSLVCLVATFGVLTLVQRRRSKGSLISGMRAGERTAVHANFVCALALLHFTRLLSEIAMQDEKACKTIAVLSHYFMLASGMWMLIEGMLLYLNVIVRSLKSTALGVHKYWTGWGIPAVIVIISAAVGLKRDTYIDIIQDECFIEDGVEKTRLGPGKIYQPFCWLGREEYVLWAAVGPLILIFSINVFILTHTVVFIWRLNRKTDKMMPSDYNNDSRHFWKTTKSVLVLFPILGVPWLIGFAINTEQSTVNLIFQYIHVILNGLQGFFIFLLYCVVNRESRGIVSRVASSRWEQHKVSVSASNTLARSTSGGSRRKGRRKSISSQMASDQNVGGTPVNITRMGSQYSVYTSSMNRKQSSGSGSTSLSGCAHRINRIISVGSTDNPGVRHKPYYMKPGSSASMPRIGKVDGYKFTSRGIGYYTKVGSSASLPRLGKFDNQRHLMRSGSFSTINMIGRNYRERYQHLLAPELADTFICKLCKDTPCIHALGDVAGMQELQDGSQEPVLTSYKRTSSLDNIQISIPAPQAQEIYSQNRWPRRMTAEEFKRFSAIPEEKRRSGINSFISVDSNEYVSNRMSVLSSLKTEEIEMKEIHETVTKVDVLPESSYNDILTEQNESGPGSDSENSSDSEWHSADDNVKSRQSSIPEIIITNVEMKNSDVTLHDDEDTVTKEAIPEKEHEKNIDEKDKDPELMEEQPYKQQHDIISEDAIIDQASAEAMERLREEELKLTD